CISLRSLCTVFPYNDALPILLNAELLGIEQVAGGYLASVRYSGMLREERDGDAFRFEEVWNLYKQDNAGWLVAGIQQMPTNEHRSEEHTSELQSREKLVCRLL